MLDPKEERAKFISLREALFLIAQHKDKTAQEAAEMLLLNLNKNEDWVGLQALEFDPTCGMLHSHQAANALRHRLWRLADHNDYSPETANDIPF